MKGGGSRRGGWGEPEIYRFCEELRATKYPDGLPSGQSAITPGAKLPAKWMSSGFNK